MQKQVFLEQFRRRAEERSCPARKLRKQAEELELHHDFLQHTFRKDGLSDFDAEAKASKQLGNPIALADESADAVRQASWWGRHPIIGYVVLPLVALGPAFVFSVLMMILLVVGVLFTKEQRDGFFDYRQNLNLFGDIRTLAQGLIVIHYAVLTLLTLPFTWMARRSASGLGWAAVPCLICACQGMFLHLSITRSGPRLYYGLSPVWIAGLGPLLITVAGFVRQWQKLRKLQPLPPDTNRKPTGLAALGALLNAPMSSYRADPITAFVKKDRLQKALKTPTYWVIAIILMITIPLLVLGRIAASGAQRAAARNQARQSNPSNTPR
jgi:hypothetical protein